MLTAATAITSANTSNCTEPGTSPAIQEPPSVPTMPGTPNSSAKRQLTSFSLA